MREAGRVQRKEDSGATARRARVARVARRALGSLRRSLDVRVDPSTGRRGQAALGIIIAAVSILVAASVAVSIAAVGQSPIAAQNANAGDALAAARAGIADFLNRVLANPAYATEYCSNHAFSSDCGKEGPDPHNVAFVAQLSPASNPAQSPWEQVQGSGNGQGNGSEWFQYVVDPKGDGQCQGNQVLIVSSGWAGAPPQTGRGTMQTVADCITVGGAFSQFADWTDHQSVDPEQFVVTNADGLPTSCTNENLESIGCVLLWNSVNPTTFGLAASNALEDLGENIGSFFGFGGDPYEPGEIYQLAHDLCGYYGWQQNPYTALASDFAADGGGNDADGSNSDSDADAGPGNLTEGPGLGCAANNFISTAAGTDTVNGRLQTNDQYYVCGTPNFSEPSSVSGPEVTAGNQAASPPDTGAFYNIQGIGLYVNVFGFNLTTVSVCNTGSSSWSWPTINGISGGTSAPYSYGSSQSSLLAENCFATEPTGSSNNDSGADASGTSCDGDSDDQPTPPSWPNQMTSTQLQAYAKAAFCVFAGPTVIHLEGSSFTYTNNAGGVIGGGCISQLSNQGLSSPYTGTHTVSLASSGGFQDLIYVQNDAGSGTAPDGGQAPGFSTSWNIPASGCSWNHNYWIEQEGQDWAGVWGAGATTADVPPPCDAGDALVYGSFGDPSGSASEQLTIVAQNDVWIVGSIEYANSGCGNSATTWQQSTCPDLIGLAAYNNVKINHPVSCIAPVVGCVDGLGYKNDTNFHFDEQVAGGGSGQSTLGYPAPGLTNPPNPNPNFDDEPCDQTAPSGQTTAGGPLNGFLGLGCGSPEQTPGDSAPADESSCTGPGQPASNCAGPGDDIGAGSNTNVPVEPAMTESFGSVLGALNPTSGCPDQALRDPDAYSEDLLSTFGTWGNDNENDQQYCDSDNSNANIEAADEPQATGQQNPLQGIQALGNDTDTDADADGDANNDGSESSTAPGQDTNENETPCVLGLGEQCGDSSPEPDPQDSSDEQCYLVLGIGTGDCQVSNPTNGDADNSYTTSGTATNDTGDVASASATGQQPGDEEPHCEPNAVPSTNGCTTYDDEAPDSPSPGAGGPTDEDAAGDNDLTQDGGSENETGSCDAGQQNAATSCGDADENVPEPSIETDPYDGGKDDSDDGSGEYGAGCLWLCDQSDSSLQKNDADADESSPEYGSNDVDNQVVSFGTNGVLRLSGDQDGNDSEAGSCEQGSSTDCDGDGSYADPTYSDGDDGLGNLCEGSTTWPCGDNDGGNPSAVDESQNEGFSTTPDGDGDESPELGSNDVDASGDADGNDAENGCDGSSCQDGDETSIDPNDNDDGSGEYGARCLWLCDTSDGTSSANPGDVCSNEDLMGESGQACNDNDGDDSQDGSDSDYCGWFGCASEPDGDDTSEPSNGGSDMPSEADGDDYQEASGGGSDATEDQGDAEPCSTDEAYGYRNPDCGEAGATYEPQSSSDTSDAYEDPANEPEHCGTWSSTYTYTPEYQGYGGSDCGEPAQNNEPASGGSDSAEDVSGEAEHCQSTEPSPPGAPSNGDCNEVNVGALEPGGDAQGDQESSIPLVNDEPTSDAADNDTDDVCVSIYQASGGLIGGQTCSEPSGSADTDEQDVTSEPLVESSADPDRLVDTLQGGDPGPDADQVPASPDGDESTEPVASDPKNTDVASDRCTGEVCASDYDQDDAQTAGELPSPFDPDVTSDIYPPDGDGDEPTGATEPSGYHDTDNYAEVASLDSDGDCPQGSSSCTTDFDGDDEHPVLVEPTGSLDSDALSDACRSGNGVVCPPDGDGDDQNVDTNEQPGSDADDLQPGSEPQASNFDQLDTGSVPYPAGTCQSTGNGCSTAQGAASVTTRPACPSGLAPGETGPPEPNDPSYQDDVSTGPGPDGGPSYVQESPPDATDDTAGDFDDYCIAVAENDAAGAGIDESDNLISPSGSTADSPEDADNDGDGATDTDNDPTSDAPYECSLLSAFQSLLGGGLGNVINDCISDFADLALDFADESNDYLGDGTIPPGGGPSYDLLNQQDSLDPETPFPTITNPSSTNCHGSTVTLCIDAAIDAPNHSFVLANYSMGGTLGTIELNGAVIAKYAGPIGLSSFEGIAGGPSGYVKDYNYDLRLSTEAPYMLGTTPTVASFRQVPPGTVP